MKTVSPYRFFQEYFYFYTKKSDLSLATTHSYTSAYFFHLTHHRQLPVSIQIDIILFNNYASI